jgi:AraC family transcriptional regulator, positive regulator of tynA and feaB
MDAVTRHDVSVFETPQLQYEAWKETVRLTRGRYNPGGVEPAAFTGWAHAGSIFGFKTLDMASNAGAMQRSYRDVRLDGVDLYFVVFQVSGKTILAEHNDQKVRLTGNVILVDATRPLAAVGGGDGNGDRWNTISINLPRKELVSHLGFDPGGGLCRASATPAARLLLDLIRNSGPDKHSKSSPSDSYMQLVIYDLVGALFAPTDPGPVSRQTDKLFTRISGVIRAGFADPDFGPAQVAAQARISLRYLHKLFMERGLTCREFIYSRRLDHAANLLRRRASLATEQPLSDIAYACGFSDYAHFSRKFRHRYGQSPGTYCPEEGGSQSAQTAVN